MRHLSVSGWKNLEILLQPRCMTGLRRIILTSQKYRRRPFLILFLGFGKSIDCQFQQQEELPYGKQAQVDFGEYNIRTTTGTRTKIFFFTMVLSRSRFKYVWFTDRYFTSKTAIYAHEKAFEYIGGVPDEVVYDQDKVFIVSENAGDIILTEEFRKYTRAQTFDLYFCRKSDPQSKGKIEML